MRQPLCGLLLCAVVTCATAPAAANTTAPVPPAARAAPCAGQHNAQVAQDSNCCKVPSFASADISVPKSAILATVASNKHDDMGGPRK
jgi:hypothetical protein